MPYLFQQWGDVLSVVAGVMWFGLLFFAGITSSLAMGTPWMGFMRDEFGWGRNKGAWSFGAMALILGLPTVLFISKEFLTNMIIGQEPLVWLFCDVRNNLIFLVLEWIKDGKKLQVEQILKCQAFINISLNM